jgi:hypothetical protein
MCVPFFLSNLATRRTVVSANTRGDTAGRTEYYLAAPVRTLPRRRTAMSDNRQILILQLALVAAIVLILLFIAFSR